MVKQNSVLLAKSLHLSKQKILLKRTKHQEYCFQYYLKNFVRKDSIVIFKNLSLFLDGCHFTVRYRKLYKNQKRENLQLFKTFHLLQNNSELLFLHKLFMNNTFQPRVKNDTSNMVLLSKNLCASHNLEFFFSFRAALLHLDQYFQIYSKKIEYCDFLNYFSYSVSKQIN
jgi:hypothetical protein